MMTDFKLIGDINPERKRRFFKYLLQNAARVRAEKDVAYRMKFLSKIEKLNDGDMDEEVETRSKNEIKKELIEKANNTLNKKTLEKALFESANELRNVSNNIDNSKENKRNNPSVNLVSKNKLVKQLKERINLIQSKARSLPTNDPLVSALHEKITQLNKKLNSLEGVGKGKRVVNKKITKKNTNAKNTNKKDISKNTKRISKNSRARR